MVVNGERARILVTVKAAPQPSAKYGDTVCVAGIRVDTGEHDWVRLYPVPFRWLDANSQFGKYDIVELFMRRRTQDSRKESYVPHTQSIRVSQHLDGWEERTPFINDVALTTTCRLMREAETDHAAPSLGMVSVAELIDFTLEEHPGWSAEEQAKIDRSMAAGEMDVFGTSTQPTKLRAPRVKLRYRYRCHEERCPGHFGQNLDWELRAFQNRFHSDSIGRLKERVEQRFVDMMFSPKRSTSFFMGNFEAAIKRSKFSVLGVYWPPAGVASKVTLF